MYMLTETSEYNRLAGTMGNLPFFPDQLPSGDYLERHLDLNELLIQHPAATFFFRVDADSAGDSELKSGDILVVDRSREPVDRSLAVTVFDGELAVRRLVLRRGQLAPVSIGSPEGTTHEITEREFELWGVVTAIIRVP